MSESRSKWNWRRWRLALVALQPLLLLWAVAERGSWHPRLMRAHESPVLGLTFSRDGRTLASASTRRAVLCDAQSLEVKSSIPLSLHPRAQTVAFAPDLSTVLGTEKYNSPEAIEAGWPGDNHRLVLFDMASGKRRWADGNDHSIGGLAFSPRGDALATCSPSIGMTVIGEYGWSALWTVRGTPKSKRLLSSSDPTRCLAWASDGATLVVGLEDGGLRLWSVRERRWLRSLNAAKDEANRSTSVWNIAFSPDAQMIASGHADNSVRLWDAATGKLLRTLKSPLKAASFVAFSPDGNLLACGGAGVALWDVRTGKHQRVLGVRRQHVTCLAFAPDGNTLACGYSSGDLALWRIR